MICNPGKSCYPIFECLAYFMHDIKSFFCIHHHPCLHTLRQTFPSSPSSPKVSLPQLYDELTMHGAVTTNIFAHNYTSPANGSTVATVACPYKATLPAGIVLPASGTVTPTSSSATTASASLSFLAIVAASVLLLSW